MAGSALGSLIPLAVTLGGLVTILRARHARRNGKPKVDQEDEDRRASAREMERRMASYLASRDQRSWRDDAE